MAARLFLPNLFEFIYNSIIEKGFSFLFDRLDREDWLKVRSESKIRIFAETSSMEEKAILLSKLGYGCAFVFWDKEKEKKTKVEDVVIAYVNTDEKDLQKQIVKDRVFACRDIDFIRCLQTISKVSTSKVYSVNMRYYHIKENSKVLKTRSLVYKLEAENNLNWYASTIQAGYDVEPLLEQFKINLVQFRILLALQIAPNGVLKEALQRKLERINIAGLLNDLYDMNMLSFSLNNRNIVLIDVYGIMVLDQIFAKFP